MLRALTTKSATGFLLIGQPVAIRKNRSIITARKSQPSEVSCRVISSYPELVRFNCCEGMLNKVRINQSDQVSFYVAVILTTMLSDKVFFTH
jgi:hypothetical protein